MERGIFTGGGCADRPGPPRKFAGRPTRNVSCALHVGGGNKHRTSLLEAGSCTLNAGRGGRWDGYTATLLHATSRAFTQTPAHDDPYLPCR
ncbi:hypothetical protein, partial [Burkholderia pseudomallei]|uniref:hypothetical protein n=1 Tax=Burkholderia pseudomallei TaxID=28450 RepID=UPI00406BE654